MPTATRSPRSRVSIPRAITRFRRRGGGEKGPKWAFSRPARSCRPRRCWRPRRTPRKRRSPMPCPAISAGAAAISASPPPSRPQRREPDMTLMIPTSPARQSRIENVSRRRFLKGVTAAGGLVLAVRLLPPHAALAYETGAGAMPGGVVTDPKIFVAIDPSGLVTIVAHRSEMGTGSRTTLPLGVAEELDADWARVRVVQAPGDETKYGNQDTDGSRSLRHFLQPMRQVGAAARTMLEMAAAKRWGVDVSEVEARNHQVIHHGSGQRLRHGAL